MMKYTTRMALSLILMLLCSTGLFAAPAETASNAQPADVPAQDTASPVRAAAATCNPPIKATPQKAVILDQCYATDFEYNGTTYDILVYYTEVPGSQLEVDGEVQCDADEEASGLCEHALPDTDVPGTSDNAYAVQVAEQVAIAFPFYFDRGFPVIDPETYIEVWIGEDPGNGWIQSPNILKLDDEYIAVTDVLRVRANVFHEGQHLIQEKHNDDVGWQYWYTEGIARTSQDRTDAGYDALASSSYMNQFADVLADDEDYRSSDLLTISYRATTFWTWFMDQYRTGGESEPGLGWAAIKGYYEELLDSTDGLEALEAYLAGVQGSTFAEDFIDYTLALYAYIYNPSDPRLGFLDAEINNAALGISNHTVVTTNEAYAEETATLQPRSSQYWEYIPPPTCPFVAFTFAESNSSDYAFSVLTVDTGGDLQDRWTSRSSQWARTVSTASLGRVAGVITALEGDAGSEVTIGHGCVTPTLQIKSPTSGAPAYVGEADNPRQFQVRLGVTGQDGSGVGGLTAADFTVELLDGGTVLPAQVVTALYVGDDYWLNVQAPADDDGAQTGQFYDLRVSLAGLSDTNNNAVLYVERQVDKLIVLDKSGSMSEDGRIQAARNAATLMTYELSAADRGAYIRYDDEVELVNGLAPMSDDHRADMAEAIADTDPDGQTCIGCGLQTAAAEHDAEGDDENLCVIALLSDGYENAEPFWADVAGEVTDNECYMDVIGLGATANEALLQQIAASSAGGGHYDFAPTSGDVPIDTGRAAGAEESISADLSWQNYLSRAYDAIAIRASGRQRIMSQVGDDPGVLLFPFELDPTTDELVVSVAWQNPNTTQFIRLIDPNGVMLPLAPHQTIVPGLTGEVWRVTAPQAGSWTLSVRDLPQQFHVSASARTLLEMQLYAGVPAGSQLQGVKVPILATFSGNQGPVVDAVITARVTNPAGAEKVLTLHDDGLHGDMEAGDGVYGNWYTQTTAGEISVDDPGAVVEGEEPNSRGSYLVQAVGTWQGLRREAQTAFFLAQAEDGDGDGFPDWWEVMHGLDPEDPSDVGKDPDGDGLVNRCEWQQGTDPNNPDTDGGGESDGSEVPTCSISPQDPLDPADDRIKPPSAVLVLPKARADGTPYVKLWLEGVPRRGVALVDIYRRPAGDPTQPWVLVGDGVRPPTFVDPFEDTPPFPGPSPEYRVVPFNDRGRRVLGRALTTAAVPLSRDPYPPSGSIAIDEGAQTDGKQVTLLLSALDNGDHHGDPDQGELPPGTPVLKLEMMLSTDADFASATWQPFQPQIEGFDLGNVQPGDAVTVYARFRDQAGNVSDNFDSSATILYTGLQSGVYLPLVVD